MTHLASLHAIVHGRVQGVYFRAFTAKHATELGLTGYVCNLPGGEAVEVQAEGERDGLEKLVGYLHAGPPGAKVEKVETNWADYLASYPDFSIKRGPVSP